MSYDELYDLLFKTVTERAGAIDPEMLMPIIGLDEGGPLNLGTLVAAGTS